MSIQEIRKKFCPKQRQTRRPSKSAFEHTSKTLIKKWKNSKKNSKILTDFLKSPWSATTIKISLSYFLDGETNRKKRRDWSWFDVFKVAGRGKGYISGKKILPQEEPTFLCVQWCMNWKDTKLKDFSKKLYDFSFGYNPFDCFELIWKYENWKEKSQRMIIFDIF